MNIVQALKEIWPYIQEFGFKEINLKAFIANNRAISYLLITCFLLFGLYVYAIEQAYLRLLNNDRLRQEIVVLEERLAVCKESNESLDRLCDSGSVSMSDNNAALRDLMGASNER